MADHPQRDLTPPFVPPAHRGAITAACLLAQFMAAVESTIVGTAMPTIIGDLGGFHLFSWVFASYLLAQGVSTPVYGRLADLFGRKRVFFAGAALFLTGSAACGLAWGMVPLIAFRTIQGLGAGAIQPVAWTIIGDIYSPADRARMQGWLSAVFGMSAIGGPAIGAFIVVHLHWSLVFWVNLPVGAATVAVLAWALEERLAPTRRRIDAVGAALLMLGVGALLAAVVQAATLAGSAIAALLAVAAASLGSLAFYEARIAEPIVPFNLWRMPVIAIGNLGSLTIGVLMMCNGGYLPAYVQGAMGATPTVAGWVLGTSSIAWTFGTMGAARVMNRASYRAAGVTGSVIMLLGTAMLLTLQAWPGPLWAAAGAAMLGLGLGFANTTFIVAVQTAVGWSGRGAATAANLFMRTIGQALGAALFGAVLAFVVAARAPDAGDAVNRLLQPGMRATLGAATVTRLSDAIAAGMGISYVIVGMLAVVVLVFSLRIPARLSPTRTAARPAKLASGAADD